MRGENRSTRRNTCPSATLSTIYLTWTDLESNGGLLGKRSEDYVHLSYILQDTQRTCNVTFRRVRITIVAVEMQ